MVTDRRAARAPSLRSPLRPPDALELLHPSGQVAERARRIVLRRRRRFAPVVVVVAEQRPIDGPDRDRRNVAGVVAGRRRRSGFRPFPGRRSVRTRAGLGRAAARPGAGVRVIREGGGRPHGNRVGQRTRPRPGDQRLNAHHEHDEQPGGHVRILTPGGAGVFPAHSLTRRNCSSSFLTDTPDFAPSSWAKSCTRNSSISQRRASSSGSTMPLSSCWLFRSRYARWKTST